MQYRRDEVGCVSALGFCEEPGYPRLETGLTCGSHKSDKVTITPIQPCERIKPPMSRVREVRRGLGGARNDIRPPLWFSDFVEKTTVQRFLRSEYGRRFQKRSGIIGANCLYKPTGSQRNSETKPRHSKLRMLSRDTLRARTQQVGTGAVAGAMRKPQRGERCVVNPLQEHLDADEAEHQVTVRLALKPGKVKACAECRAFSTDYNEAHSLLGRIIEGADQGFHKF